MDIKKMIRDMTLDSSSLVLKARLLFFFERRT